MSLSSFEQQEMPVDGPVVVEGTIPRRKLMRLLRGVAVVVNVPRSVRRASLKGRAPLCREGLHLPNGLSFRPGHSDHILGVDSDRLRGEGQDGRRTWVAVNCATIIERGLRYVPYPGMTFQLERDGANGMLLASFTLPDLTDMSLHRMWRQRHITLCRMTYEAVRKD